MSHKRAKDRRRLAKKLFWLPEKLRLKTADHPKKCSCEMCGNPRRHFGERTIQERRHE